MSWATASRRSTCAPPRHARAKAPRNCLPNFETAPAVETFLGVVRKAPPVPSQSRAAGARSRSTRYRVEKKGPGAVTVRPRRQSPGSGPPPGPDAGAVHARAPSMRPAPPAPPAAGPSRGRSPRSPRGGRGGFSAAWTRPPPAGPGGRGVWPPSPAAGRPRRRGGGAWRGRDGLAAGAPPFAPRRRRARSRRRRRRRRPCPSCRGARARGKPARGDLDAPLDGGGSARGGSGSSRAAASSNARCSSGLSLGGAGPLVVLLAEGSVWPSRCRPSPVPARPRRPRRTAERAARDDRSPCAALTVSRRPMPSAASRMSSRSMSLLRPVARVEERVDHPHDRESRHASR